jgi:hypothetical protein
VLNEEDIAQRSLPDLPVRGTEDWTLAGCVMPYDKVKWVISNCSAYKPCHSTT